MPCYDPGPYPYSPPARYEPLNNKSPFGEITLEGQVSYYKQRADLCARAACDMRTILRRNNLEKELTMETQMWILQHDAFDKARIEEENKSGLREQVRLQALNKLTLEERRVLGL